MTIKKNRIKRCCRYIIFGFAFLFLTACGLGEQSLKLPEKRPYGTIEGNVLGGLYSGGNISAYAINKRGERQYIAHSTITEEGEFTLTFSAPTQTILLEANNGHYRDPSQPGLPLSP